MGAGVSVRRNLIAIAALAMWFVVPAGTAFGDVIPGVETHGFGNTYVLLDSTDGGGPTFDSPVYAPATVAATLTDDNFEQANLGFAFEFYGGAHASVFISSNGYLTFNNGSNIATNGDLATEANVTDPGIFAFFDDLYPADPTGTGEVRYGTFGPAGSRVFVVEFDDVYRFGPETSGGTFQIRLFETTNVIEFHYSDLVWGNPTIDFGAGATVGIRAGGPGSAYLQYSVNSAVVDNGLAVRLWQPTCGGKTVTLVGDRGADLLNGVAGVDDVIYGHQGNDTINGLDGNDTICAGGGHDTVDGGGGADTIFGNNGTDTIQGNNGNDTIHGGIGADTIFGGGGSDTIYGDNGTDTIRGNNGNDTIWGGFKDDLIYGLAGNDIIHGNNGDDELHGNGGADTIYGDVGNDTIGGELGADRLYGFGGNDVIRGGGGVDAVFGNVGNDKLSGGGNNDSLAGGPGIDVCRGNNGVDTASGCETSFGIP